VKLSKLPNFVQYDGSSCHSVHIPVSDYDGTMIADATAIRKIAIQSIGLTTEPSTGFGVHLVDRLDCRPEFGI
jgi:hypothetical protein